VPEDGKAASPEDSSAQLRLPAPGGSNPSATVFRCATDQGVGTALREPAAEDMGSVSSARGGQRGWRPGARGTARPPPRQRNGGNRAELPAPAAASAAEKGFEVLYHNESNPVLWGAGRHSAATSRAAAAVPRAPGETALSLLVVFLGRHGPGKAGDGERLVKVARERKAIRRENPHENEARNGARQQPSPGKRRPLVCRGQTDGRPPDLSRLRSQHAQSDERGPRSPSELALPLRPLPSAICERSCLRLGKLDRAYSSYATKWAITFSHHPRTRVEPASWNRKAL